VILGVTPARGGSKGIIRKNLVPVAGKPLLAWTIEAARRSRLIDRYVVSTEDAEIAAVARSYGAEVLERSAELADDETSTLAVLQHALDRIPAKAVVVLQATSPIRNDGLVDRCIRQFVEEAADSLATGFMCKFVEYGRNYRRRQDIDGFFYDDGNVYVIDGALVRRGERYGARMVRVLLDREQSIEIDDPFDLWIADVVLRAREEGRGCRL